MRKLLIPIGALLLTFAVGLAVFGRIGGASVPEFLAVFLAAYVLLVMARTAFSHARKPLRYSSFE